MAKRTLSDNVQILRLKILFTFDSSCNKVLTGNRRESLIISERKEQLIFEKTTVSD